MSTVTIRDFQPWNNWTDTHAMDIYGYNEEFHCDESTKKRYWIQSPDTLREKCGLLMPWTVLAHTYRIALRILSFISLYQFHYRSNGQVDESGYRVMIHYSLKERVKEAGKDLLKIIATPVLVLFLESAALYGLLNPYDGRKLYASGERFAYEALGMEGVDLFDRPAPAYCAPCFQPDATHHALGGDANDGNAW